MKHRGILTILAAISLAGVFISCSMSPSRHEAGVTVRLEVPVQAASGLEQLVESVTLLIFADDVDTMLYILPVVQGKVSRTIDVPPGEDRIFEMSAADADGRRLYFGADTVSVGRDLDQVVNIVLRPVILLMRLSPRYQEVEVGTSCAIDVYIFNVDSLFGAAFRLVYDRYEIRIDDWSEGDFLGTGADVISEAFLKGDSLAISYARNGNLYDYGVSGSGRLATVYLTPLTPGESEIRLAIHSDEALSKLVVAPSNRILAPVDRIEDLYLDGAIVAGRGTER